MKLFVKRIISPKLCNNEVSGAKSYNIFVPTKPTKTKNKISLSEDVISRTYLFNCLLWDKWGTWNCKKTVMIRTLRICSYFNKRRNCCLMSDFPCWLSLLWAASLAFTLWIMNSHLSSPGIMWNLMYFRTITNSSFSICKSSICMRKINMLCTECTFLLQTILGKQLQLTKVQKNNSSWAKCSKLQFFSHYLHFHCHHYSMLLTGIAIINRKLPGRLLKLFCKLYKHFLETKV